MMYLETKLQTQTKNRIIDAIEEGTGVPRLLWETRRGRGTTEVILRHIYIHMLYNSSLFTLETIARMVGLKNHSTVLQSIARSKEWYEKPEEFETEIIMLNAVKQSYEQGNS